MNPAIAPAVRTALYSRWEPVNRSQLTYLVTWYTRGRRPVLKDRHLAALEETIHAVSDDRSITLLELTVVRDHVHLLFALRPAQNVASAVRELKGRSGMTLMAHFPELRVWLGGHLMWDERYAVETVSPARLERVRGRLRALHGHEDQLAQAS